MTTDPAPALPPRIARLRIATGIAAFVLSTIFSAAANAQAFNTGGTVTWYNAGDGSATACLMGPTPTATAPFGLTAAISEADWNGSESCGQFIELRTTESSCAGTPPFCNEELLTGAPVIVQINDRCPITDCPSGHFDLNMAAFETLAPTGVGIISDVEWRPVHGLFDGNVRILSQSGGSQFFPILTPIDHNVTIARLEVTNAALGTWIELPRNESVNLFQGSIPAPYLTLPASVRLTGTNGEVIVGTDVITSFTAGDTSELGAQFSPPAPPVPIPIVVPLAVCLGGLLMTRRALRNLDSTDRGNH